MGWRSRWGCGLALAVLLAGCGVSDDDVVMREGIALKQEGAAIWEQVTDAPSFEEAKKKIKGVNERIEALGNKTEAWSEARKEAMYRKYEKEFVAGNKRYDEAKVAAIRRASGKKE